MPGPSDAPVETLCGKTFTAAGYQVTKDEADCSACLRRRSDPAAVSSAFFAHGGGSQLLELALAEAAKRERRPERAAAPKTRPKPAAPPAPPEQAGELKTAGFRPAEGGVWRSREGAIVRLAGERLAELLAEGRIRVTRKGNRMTIEAGDVRLDLDVDSVGVRAK